MPSGVCSRLLFSTNTQVDTSGLAHFAAVLLVATSVLYTYAIDVYIFCDIQHIHIYIISMDP